MWGCHAYYENTLQIVPRLQAVLEHISFGQAKSLCRRGLDILHTVKMVIT